MLTSIELESYRGFKRYELRDLSRVNLLVGKNNCGKTSLLEAVQLLASGGDPSVLAANAWQRGEVLFKGKEREGHTREAYPVVSHFFHGHEFAPGSCFSIRANDALGQLTVRVVPLADEHEQLRLFEGAADLRTTLALKFEKSPGARGRRVPVYPVSEEGALHPDVSYRYRRIPRRDGAERQSVQFISPDSLEPSSMAEMWNRVLVDGREPEVREAMRILEPGLTNIFFLTGEPAYHWAGRAGILVAFEGTQRRDPLGSRGEGMRRLLALSLSLIRSQGGVLLVDEIDTGLHYSIMGDMWRLVVESARRSDVRVFATTHSFDCVRGLAWLCDNYPDLRSEVSLQKIDCDLERAVALDANQIVLAVNQGMEVR